MGLSPSTHVDSSSCSLGPKQPSHPMVTRSKNDIFKPKELHLATKFSLSDQIEPSCLSQILKHFEWRQAMLEGFNALLVNGTWSFVPQQPQFNIIGNKWVFRLKRDPDGSIARYKVCLVSKGFDQHPGINYTKTYSPIIKPQTIKLVLCIANGLCQMDVNNAFLHGSILEDIYMYQPPGFFNSDFPYYVCKLRKVL